MSNNKAFNYLNYKDNARHYSNYLIGGKDEIHAKTWLEKDTVDAWRHRRMYCALDPILETEKATWLTIGDGRYGKDSKYISDKGGDVLASDLCDFLLQEAKEMGFISKFCMQNAESLTFEDASFDYVSCKESYHHFPRPMVALYEMLRVASKGVVLIEPNDLYIGQSMCRSFLVRLANSLLSIVGKGVPSHHFEEFGNYVYTISRRELEKVALGMNYRYLAFKGLNDNYVPGVEFEKASENSKLFKKLKMKIFLRDMLVKLRLLDYGMLVAILFKQPPSLLLIERLKDSGFDLIELPANPIYTAN